MSAPREANTQNSQLATRYNTRVANDSKILRAETIGLIVIAVMLTLMVLARWAGIIPWGAR